MPNALEVKLIAIEKIKLLERNPRKINEERFKKLCESVDKNPDFFNVRPCLINDSSGELVVYAGNQRLRAAKAMGWKEVPCIIETLTDEQQRERTIRDNVELGEWDWELLAEDWKKDELESWGVECEFNTDEEGKTDPDEVPPVPEIPKAKLGDIYQLGEHRLMCGDATSPEDVEKLMGGEKADMVFTDPPYNVNYKGQGKNTSNTIMNDNMSDGDFGTFLEETFSNYLKSIKAGAGVYVFHSSSSQRDFENAMEKTGFKIKNQLIWNKPNSALGWGDYRWKHEPFFYACVEGESTVFYGDRTHSTVWDFNQKTDQQLLKIIKSARAAEKNGKTTIWSLKRDKTNEYAHPTQKPAELIRYAIRNSSKSGDVIIDFFGGSGSTIIAAEQTKRRCYMMELDEKYIDVIIKRWEDFTGKIATKL